MRATTITLLSAVLTVSCVMTGLMDTCLAAEKQKTAAKAAGSKDKQAKKEKKAAQKAKAEKKKGIPPEAFNMGPTGIMVVRDSGKQRGLRVVKVDVGSPADGKVSVGDYLEKANGKTWAKGTTGRVWAPIIDEAEAKDGTLELGIRGGKTVTLQLKVLGDYSATAPYNCKKSEAIMTQLADYLISTPEGKNAKPVLGGHMNAGVLGLMATGEDKYQKIAFQKIKANPMSRVTEKDMNDILDGTNASGSISWAWGYNLVALGEYYLLTGDKSVLPAMKWQALTLARGQDAAGMYGHRMAIALRNNRIPGYGAMNQPTISCLVGMMFAKKCGIEHPDLDKAIEKTQNYVASFVGRGGFGYGTGSSSSSFNNNGTSASAAMAMHLAGNKEGVRYFSQISAASHQGLEAGHASAFFNPLWTPLGANLAGPEVTQGFFKKSMRFHNLKRTWKGEYTGKGSEGPHAGYALLMYALPRKALIITGREADDSLWVKGSAATDVLNMASMNLPKKSDEELMALLEHPIPQVKGRAASALQERDASLIAPKLLKVINSSSASVGAKEAALEYFRKQTKTAAKNDGPLMAYVDDIGAVIKDPKQPIKVRAAAGLALGFGNYGEKAHPYYEDIVKLHREPMPKDELPGKTRTTIAFAHGRLCASPLKEGIKIDPDLLYDSAKTLMTHKRQNARGIGVKMLLGIPEEDFHLVSDALQVALKDDDPTFETYGNTFAVRNPGITILADLRIKEGMDYLLAMVPRGDGTNSGGGGKWAFKMRTILEILPRYGAHAEPYIAKFEESPNIYPSSQRLTRFSPLWDEVVKGIKEDQNPPTLRSIAEMSK